MQLGVSLEQRPVVWFHRRHCHTDRYDFVDGLEYYSVDEQSTNGRCVCSVCGVCSMHVVMCVCLWDSFFVSISYSLFIYERFPIDTRRNWSSQVILVSHIDRIRFRSVFSEPPWIFPSRCSTFQNWLTSCGRSFARWRLSNVGFITGG